MGDFLECFSASVCHAIELPYVFHPTSVLGGLINLAERFTDAEEYMSQRMIDYWVGFANGDPNFYKPPVSWPEFSSENQNLIDISTTIVTGKWDTDVCDFWDQVGYNY